MADNPNWSWHSRSVCAHGRSRMRAALYPNSPIAQHTDYGMWGMATPSEAAAPRLGEDKDKDDKDSVLEDR